MTKVNRTSSKHRKPGVYIDPSTHHNDSNQSFLKQVRAKKFQAIRASKGPMPVTAMAAAAATAQAQVDAEQVAHDAAEKERLRLDALPRGLDGFTVSVQPFCTTDSSALSMSTASSLSEEKILGAALYEWLLTKQDWDCHTLWEKFLQDWDLITETERPPGTNRPINLHGYLTYLKSVNNKRVVRKQIKDVRDTLQREREEDVRRNGETDVLAEANLRALNGSLLSYFLKVKQLIPYESKNQLKKKEAAERKRKAELGEKADTSEEKNGDDDSSSSSQQPAKKKMKSTDTKPLAASSSTSLAKLGQPSCFAALLDCD